MKQTRMKHEARKEDILEAALPLAVQLGYANVTRNHIAHAIGVSGTTVQYHFGTMAQLRRAVMRLAIHTRCLAVIAQGLSAGDEQAKKAPPELQREALDSLIS